MRKLKLVVQTSMDGFIADANEKTDWMIWNWGDEWKWDEELQRYFTDLTQSIDTVLLSRKMAVEGFVNHWRETEKRNNSQREFASVINKARKIVFTKTLEVIDLPNTTLAKGDLTDEIELLTVQDGKDIIVYGGALFISNLLKENLIDELYLFVNPVVLGNGLRIFNELTPLKIKSTELFSCGLMVVVCEPANH